MQPVKKLDIASLKVINKKNLNTLHGGSAPAVFSSLFDDRDKGSGCSLASDTDYPN